MNLNHSFRRARHGSVLLVAVVVLALVGVALAFALQRMQTQTQFSARAQSWNYGIALAESGIEEGLAHSQYNYSNMVSQGWTLSLGLYVQQRQFDVDFFHVSILTNASSGPRFTNRITSAGCIYLPSLDTFICRTVAVDVVRIENAPVAILARNGIRMNGNPTYVDSYDSRDPAKSTGGGYDPAKRQANALAGCVSGTFDLGNGDIWGKIVEGPNVTGVSTGPNCSVGNLLWHSTGNHGIQMGARISDPSLSAPDNLAPFTTAPTPPPLILGTTNYAAVLDNGDYMVSGNLNGRILVRGNARLYVTGNVTVTGSSFLQLSPGASLRLSVGGANVNIQDVRMTPGTSTFLGVYGLPSVNHVSVDTGPTSPCFINAPSANFSMHGNSQFYGAVVCDRYSSGGSPAFHFDEALSALAATPQFTILSWAER
jgi:hypothetical protein